VDRRPRRVLVTGVAPLVAGLARGLADRGDRVVVAGPAAAPIGTVGAVACAFSSEAEVAAAVAVAAGPPGRLDLLVHTWLAPDVLVERDLVDVEPAAWAAAADASLDAGWWLSRSIGAALALSDRGSAVFVVPSVGLAGAAGYAMLAAVAEGVRVLATSCARQWAADGTTVNTIAAPAHLWTDAETDLDDLVPLVAALGGDDLRGLTAATLVAGSGVQATQAGP
jgi:NAD(P)-dependent dehydrogenase (short-subunit alcohol dehydrogenase family)